MVREQNNTIWHVLDQKTGKRLLTDRLELVIIEIPKAIRKYKENGKDKISQWMMFLENPSNKEVIKIMDENEDIRKAAEELNAMSEDLLMKAPGEVTKEQLRELKIKIDL